VTASVTVDAYSDS